MHIADSRHLAEAAELKNITFLEESFDRLLSHDLPQFDVIALHGVHSWISQENRKAIVRFISDRLRSAGIVYVSYNALPGNASNVPIKQLLSIYAEQIPGDMMTKISGAVAAVRSVSDVGGGYFASARTVKTTLDRIFRHEETNRRYLAHEYFNRDWNPCFFADVAAEMSGAKLTFVTSANVFENNLESCLTEEARKVVAEAPTTVLRETLKDYYLNQAFRRDIYMRGVPKLSRQERMELLSRIPFVLEAERASFQGLIDTNTVQIKYRREKYDPILDALESGPKTIAELLQETVSPEVPVENLIQLLSYWVAADQLSPGWAGTDSTAASRINRTILSQARYDDSLHYLACSETGSGIRVPWIWQLFLLGIKEGKAGEQIPDFAWSILKNQGRRLLKGTEPLLDDAANRDRLRQDWITFNAHHRQRLERLNLF